MSARKRWVLQEAWEIATNFVQLGKFGVGGEADHWIAFGQKAARLLMHATRHVALCEGPIVLRMLDAAGRPVRQIELYDRYADAVVVREQKRGLEILDRRDWR